MKDNYPDGETFSAKPEFEGADPLKELEALLPILGMVDPQAIEDLLTSFSETVEDYSRRMGMIAALTGNCSFRAVTKFIKCGDGAVSGHLVFSADNRSFINAGMTPEQGIKAISEAFNALNDFFNSLRRD